MTTSLASILSTCGVLLIDSTLHVDQQQFHDHSKVIAKEPWQYMDTISTPDCVFLLVNLDTYDNASMAVNKSRVDIKIILMVKPEDQTPFYLKELAYDDKFDTIVVYSKSNKSLHVDTFYDADFKHLSPFDDRGLARKRSLRISYTLMIPYVIRSEEPVPFGMDRDVMLSLAKALNLKLTFLFAKKIPHIVTMIVKGQADMSISHASLLYGFYSKGVDVSTTLRTKSLIFAVGHDVPIESYATVIIRPFTKGVWFTTLGAFLVVLAVIGVLNRVFLKKLLDFNGASAVLVPLLNTNISWAWFIATRHWYSFRIIITFWLFVGLFLSLAFKSTLLASLVKRDVQKTPETFQELLDQNIEVYTVTNPVFTNLLEFSPFEVQRKVWTEGVQKRGGLYSGGIIPPETIERIRDGHAATVRGEDILLEHGHIMKRGKEPLQDMVNAGYYYAIKLPLKQELDKALLSYKDFGILGKMRSKYAWILGEKGRVHQRSKPDIGPEALKISQILTAIYATLVFYCFICLIFLYERASGYRPRKLNILKDPEFKVERQENLDIQRPEIYY